MLVLSIAFCRVSAVSAQMAVEQRVALLEKQVADLTQRLDALEMGATWIDRIAGSFKDDAGFLEILRLGREIRKADRLPENEPPAESP